MKINFRNIISLAILFFAFSTLNAQKVNIDSLKNEVLNYPTQDTIRVNLINDLLEKNYYKEREASEVLAEEIDSISKKLGYTIGQGHANLYKGRINKEKRNFDTALVYLNQAFIFYEECNYNRGMGITNHSLGYVYALMRKDSLCIAHFKKAIIYYGKTNDMKMVAKHYKNIGLVQHNLGNYDTAIVYFNYSKNIRDTIGDYTGAIMNMVNIASVYDDKGNYPKAIEIHTKALAEQEKLDSSQYESRIYVHLGGINLKHKNYDKSIEYFNQALTISKLQDNKANIALTLYMIGNTYKEQSKFDSALVLIHEALDYNKVYKKVNEAKCLISIAEIYLEMDSLDQAFDYFNQGLVIDKERGHRSGICNSKIGLTRYHINQKEYKKAEKHALEALKLAEEQQLLLQEKELNKLLAITYAETGNYKKAYEYHQDYKTANDSLFNKENIQKMTALEYEYKYKQELEAASNRELSLTKTVKTTSQDLEKSQRNSLIAIILFLLLALISGAVISFLKLKQVQAETKNIITQQKLLRSQMTPHFIFNSLSILQGLILNKEEDKSVNYLSEFSRLLRTILENSRHKTVSLSKELKAIDSYMVLQNLDMSPPYNYKLDVDPSIENIKFSIPPMLIQPFVENIIEHAFTSEKNNKEIFIDITFQNNQLLCTIKDNGIGFGANNKKDNRNKSSLATAITTERLESLSKEFNVSGYVKVENRQTYGEQGTVVTLSIPYKIN